MTTYRSATTVPQTRSGFSVIDSSFRLSQSSPLISQSGSNMSQWKSCAVKSEWEWAPFLCLSFIGWGKESTDPRALSACVHHEEGCKSTVSTPRQSLAVDTLGARPRSPYPAQLASVWADGLHQVKHGLPLHLIGIYLLRSRSNAPLFFHFLHSLPRLANLLALQSSHQASRPSRVSLSRQNCKE